MATYTKLPLSGSVNGKQILISSVTGSVPTPIHTAVSGTTSLDEIYLYAYNNNAANVQLTIQWGGTVEPDNIVKTTISPQAGRTLIVDGKLLQNGLMVAAYAQITSSIVIDGFVNRIS